MIIVNSKTRNNVLDQDVRIRASLLVRSGLLRVLSDKELRKNSSNEMMTSKCSDVLLILRLKTRFYPPRKRELKIFFPLFFRQKPEDVVAVLDHWMIETDDLMPNKDD